MTSYSNHCAPVRVVGDTIVYNVPRGVAVRGILLVFRKSALSADLLNDGGAENRALARAGFETHQLALPSTAYEFCLWMNDPQMSECLAQFSKRQRCIMVLGRGIGAYLARIFLERHKQFVRGAVYSDPIFDLGNLVTALNASVDQVHDFFRCDNLDLLALKDDLRADLGEHEVPGPSTSEDTVDAVKKVCAVR